MACFSFCGRQTRFTGFVEAVQHCTLCPRLSSRVKVMSDANGNIDSKALFVAEAPGRLGADRTGVPLHGDKTGDNFEALLGNIGWRRQDVFITNAVLCNPRQENGNNATPSRDEIENCSAYLEMTIQLIQPEVVVALGATALKALEVIHPHGRVLQRDVAGASPWSGRLLVPLYHPGPRALVHRSMANQRSDFMRLAKLVHPTKGLTKPRAPRASRSAQPGVAQMPLSHLICAIVNHLGRISYFKLTKLLYLVDFTALNRLGHTVTGEIYLRQPDGPWPPAIQKIVPVLEGCEVLKSFRGRMPLIGPGPSPRFAPCLDDEALQVVTDVLARYASYSNARMKAAAYSTAPMKYLLRAEKEGRDMRRVPLIYNDKAAPDTDGAK